MSSTFTHAIILDFEATCAQGGQPRPQEIIELPSVLISLESLETVDEFQSFVRPQHHPVLTAFCTELTSITQADVDRADTFAEVFARHHAWLDGHGLNEKSALIVTCGDWDLATMLPAQCPVAVPPIEALRPIYTRWQNLKHPYCSVQGRKRAPGMAGMLRDLGLRLVGHHHRGIDDCRNLAALYKVLLEKGASTEVSAELPLSKYPPITIRLRFGDELEEAQLRVRNVHVLWGLAGKAFKRPIATFHRQDGRPISEDGDLASLSAGEEILVT